MKEIETDFNRPRARRFIDGLKILHELAGDALEFDAQHDILYAGLFDQVNDKMTKEQREELLRNGWFEKEESWAFFT